MTNPTHQNSATYQVAPKSPVLEVRSAPYTSPKPDEIVTRNHAVALNPVNYLIQSNGTTLIFTWLRYPAVLGTDVAGEIVEVGSNVINSCVGDRHGQDPR